MTSSTLFGYDNLITRGTSTVTITSVNALYPLSNLQDPRTTREVRAVDGVQSTIILIDAAATEAVDFFAIVGNQITSDLTVTSVLIEGNATNSWGTPAFSTTCSSINYEEMFGFKSFTEQSYRWWRLTLTTSSTTVGFSKIFLGKSLDLGSQAINVGFSFQRFDRSIITEGRYGQKFIDKLNNIKLFSGSFTVMNKTEFTNIDQMFKFCGVSVPVWFVCDQNENVINDAEVIGGYFYFQDNCQIINSTWGYYDTTFNLIQVV